MNPSFDLMKKTMNPPKSLLKRPNFFVKKNSRGKSFEDITNLILEKNEVFKQRSRNLLKHVIASANSPTDNRNNFRKYFGADNTSSTYLVDTTDDELYDEAESEEMEIVFDESEVLFTRLVQYRGIQKIQSTVRGFLSRTNYQLLRLKSQLSEIECQTQTEIQEIKFLKDKELKTLKQSRSNPESKSSMETSMNLVFQLKDEYELLKMHCNEALNCKRTLIEHQLLLSSALESKNLAKESLERETIQLRLDNQNLTSKVMSLKLQVVILQDVLNNTVQVPKRISPTLTRHHQQQQQVKFNADYFINKAQELVTPTYHQVPKRITLTPTYHHRQQQQLKFNKDCIIDKAQELVMKKTPVAKLRMSIQTIQSNDCYIESL